MRAAFGQLLFYGKSMKKYNRILTILISSTIVSGVTAYIVNVNLIKQWGESGSSDVSDLASHLSSGLLLSSVTPVIFFITSLFFFLTLTKSRLSKINKTLFPLYFIISVVITGGYVALVINLLLAGYYFYKKRGVNNIKNILWKNSDETELIRRVKKKEISLIEPLWKELNTLHLESSLDFKDHFACNSFQKRQQKFLQHKEDDIQILLYENNNQPAGYIISTVSKGVGEIDSLYLKKSYRKTGMGRILTEKALTWLKGKECKKIIVTAAKGNERVLGFYREMGFRERSITMELPPQNKKI